MSNFKRVLSAFMAVLMVLGMFSCLTTVSFAGSAEGYIHDANNWDKTYTDYTASQNNNVKSYAELLNEYGSDPFIYYAVQVFEKADASTPGAFEAEGSYWVDTDHKVQPDDELLVRYYLKSSVYVADIYSFTFFSRKFFDIDNNPNKKYTSSKDYAVTNKYVADGLYNDGYRSAIPLSTSPIINQDGPLVTNLPDGCTVNDSLLIYQRASAFKANLRTERTVNTYNGLSVTDSYSWDTFILYWLYDYPITVDLPDQLGVLFDSDEYWGQNVIKVRSTSEPYKGTAGTVNYVEDGAVGYIGMEEAYDGGKVGTATHLINITTGPDASISQSVKAQSGVNCTVLTADTNHIFVIADDSAPQAGNSVNFYDGTTQLTNLTIANQTGTVDISSVTTSKAGFNFLGWADSNGNAVTSVDASQGDVNVYAIWGITATFTANGATYDTQNVQVGANITAPATSPTQAGAVFAGWYDSADATQTIVNFPVVASTAVNYVAKFSQQYTITFMDRGSSVGSQTGLEGEAIAFPTESQLAPNPGYALTGWTPADTTINASTSTYTAVWAPRDYTITYDVNGGTGSIANASVTYGTPIPAVDATGIAKTGYTLAGWTYSDGTNTYSEGDNMPAANLTATAQWSANTYTATFNVSYNGETTQYTTVDAQYGAEIEMPALPSEEGYSFSPWSPASTVMDAEGKVYTTTKTANIYTATFTNRNNGTIGSDSFAYGAVVTFPAAPGVTGMDFTGWQRSTDGGFIADGATEYMPASNVTYKAVYEGRSHTVTYYVDDVLYTTDTVNYGAVINTPAYTPATGYSFSGWQNVPETMPDEDISIYATTSINSYTITYQLDNGEADIVDTYVYGAAVTAAAAPTKEGYTFTAWDGQIPETMPAEDIVVTALWAINSYTVTYHLDNGEADVVDTYNYGEAITAPAPSKTGYDFAGWSPAVPVTMPAGNLEVTAQWTVQQYTLTYQTRDTAEGAWARFGSVVTLNYGDEITPAALKTQTGWTYSDWSTDPDSAVALPQTMPAQNIVAYSTGTKNVYTDTWYDIDGSVFAQRQVTFGDEIPAITPPEHVGYDNPYWTPRMTTQPAEDVDFHYAAAAGAATYSLIYRVEQLDGTYADETTVIDSTSNATITATNSQKQRQGFTLNENDSVLSITVAPDSSSELIIVFDRNTYNLTVVDAAGTTTVPYLYEAPVTEPTASASEGQTFANWVYTRDSNGAAISALPATMPAYNFTATARYTTNSYNLTPYVDYADGEGYVALTAVSYAYGATVATVAQQSKTGYTFNGWYADEELTVPYVFGGAMPASDVNIYGAFTANTYTITFINDVTGETFDTQEYAYGAAVTYPQAPENAGYNFTAWSQVYATMPAENVTVRAYYGTGSFSVTFDVDGVTTVKNFAYGAPVVAIADPVKVGHTFAGWSPALPVTMPAENITVTATWTVNSYEVTFIAVDGDETAYAVIADVEFGSDIAAPETDPTRTNYEFLGWKVAGTSDSAIVTFPYALDGEGITFVGVWAQDTSAIRVQNVVRVTTPYYQKQVAEYDVYINEPAYKVHLTDGSNTWTFSKGTFYNAPELSGVSNIRVDDETGLEVWTVQVSFAEAENAYKAYVTTVDFYEETEEQGYVFSVTYDVRDDEIIADECQIISVENIEKVVRGDTIVWTVHTVGNVSYLKFNYSYTQRDGTTKTFNVLCRRDAQAENTTVTREQDGSLTWTFEPKVTYSCNDPRVTQQWVLYYKTGATSEYIPVNEENPVNVLVCYDEAATVDTAEGYDKYSIVSAVPTSGTVASGSRDVITIVTTDDCDKVRVTVDGKSTTFQTTTKSNVSYSDANGLRTWLINYKYAASAGQYTVSCQARGASWREEVTYNIVIS